MKKLALASLFLALASTSALAAKVSVETFDLEKSDRAYLGAEKLAGPLEGLTFDMFIGVQDQASEELWVSADYYNTNQFGIQAFGGVFTPYVGLDYLFGRGDEESYSELETGIDYQIGDLNLDVSYRQDFVGQSVSILQTSVQYDFNETFSAEVEHRQDLNTETQQHLELRGIINFTTNVQGEVYRDIITDTTGLKLSYSF